MIGKTISHYKILEKIGEGGMGIVYKAEDTKLKRTVALKFLSTDLTRDEESKTRFIHEAQAASALEHHNICNIHEIDEIKPASGKPGEGQFFISMAYYEGKTLKDMISSVGVRQLTDEAPLQISQIIDIAIQIAQGLNKAHQNNIIHRDIKPANIMVTNEEIVKILDFGLAKLTSQTKLTKVGTTLGTVSYMAPEQTRGQSVDHRTDIWSLGVLIYEMITGQLPFKGDYEQVVMYAITNDEPEPLTTLRSGLPMQLEQIVNKCLEKEPSSRYQHVDELIVDLSALKKERGVSIQAKTISRAKTPHLAIPKINLKMLFIIVLMIIVAGLLFLMKIQRTEIVEKSWKNSIAILPFRDFSPLKDQEYFCDGMTDALNDKLSQIEELKVIATTSIMRYKNTTKDIKVIGNELGIANIVEGTIQRENNNIRVRAQLINAETGFHLWSETYNRNLESIFNVQDEISQSIAEALQMKLTSNTLEMLNEEKPQSMEVYEYYLKGMHFIKSKFVISFLEEDFQNGLKMFHKAIELDPDFALAYYGLAWAYEHHYMTTWDEQDAKKAQRNVEKSFKINPNLARTNALNGYFYYEYKNEYDRGFQLLKRALEIKPNIGEVNFLVGVCCLYHGLYPQGIKYLTKSIEIDPYYFWTPYKLAMCYMNIGEFEKAEFYFEKYFELAPLSLVFPGQYIYLCLKMKNYDKAKEMIAKAEKIDPEANWINKYKALLLALQGDKEETLALWQDEEIFAVLGMNDQAINKLEQRIEKRDKYMHIFYQHLLHNPFYDNLRDDHRFQTILQNEKNYYEENLKKYSI